MSYSHINQINAAIVIMNERLSDAERKSSIAFADNAAKMETATAAMRTLVLERLERFDGDVSKAKLTKVNPKISEKGLDAMKKAEREAEVERRKRDKADPFSRAVWLQLIRLHPGKGTMEERMQYASNVITKINRDIGASDSGEGKKPKSTDRISIVVSGANPTPAMMVEALQRTFANEKHKQRFAALAAFLTPAMDAYLKAITKPAKPSKRKASTKK